MISILEFLARLAVWLLLAPLLPGLINKVKAWVAGRRGPPVLQLYYDLARLWRKGVVLSTLASPGFIVGPAVAWTALLAVTLLLPLGPLGATLSFRGDVILLVYLLGLARFCTAWAALETGSAFEGMGAAREVSYAVLAEAAVITAVLTLSMQSGSLVLGAMLTPSAGPGAALLAVGLFTVLLALLSIAIFQFLVYLFGIAGDFIGVILLMLQLTSSGGSYPKETLPQFFITIGPYLPMTYAVAAFRDIISGNEINVSSVFGLYGAAIVLLVALTALFKWILSRDTGMIKQSRLADQISHCAPALRLLNPLNPIRVINLKLSRGFSLAARRGSQRVLSTGQALHRRASTRAAMRRAAVAQKVNGWRRPPNRRD